MWIVIGFGSFYCVLYKNRLVQVVVVSGFGKKSAKIIWPTTSSVQLINSNMATERSIMESYTLFLRNKRINLWDDDMNITKLSRIFQVGPNAVLCISQGLGILNNFSNFKS